MLAILNNLIRQIVTIANIIRRKHLAVFRDALLFRRKRPQNNYSRVNNSLYHFRQLLLKFCCKMAFPYQQPGFGAPPGYPQSTPGGYGVAPAGYAAGYAQHGGQWGPGAPASSVDPQIVQWFYSVDIDRSGRITANELQQALVNANWTQFNPETCRMMIGMFDRDMNGTIDINEFQSLWHYIQQWRSTFERFDVNRSGSIEGTELQQAYQMMGYNMSPRFIQTILYKFDHYGRRSLSLDNFIQSCVMIKSLSDAFKARDTTMTGTIHLSYEDFLTMAVLYKP